MKPDFEQAKRHAVFLLAKQEHMFQFAVDIKSLSFEQNIIIDSIEHYAAVTDIDQDYDKCCALYYGLRHGCTIRIGASGTYVILYDEKESNRRRLNWSLSHEVGHICLCHGADGPAEEVEANFFAAQLLAPDAVLLELQRNGVSITERFLYERFFLSREAARKKLDYLHRCSGNLVPDPEIAKVFHTPLRREIAFNKVRGVPCHLSSSPN